MNYRSLAAFLEDLREAGELERIDTEVDACGEVAELARKSTLARGSALLFGIVKGRDLPVVANLFGTEARICRALGVNKLDEAVERIERLVSPPEKEGLFSKWLGSAEKNLAAGFAPRMVNSAACQQIVRLGGDVDLTRLPFVQDRLETCPTIAWAPIIAASEAGRTVSGRYNVQLLDHRRLAIGFADCDEPARVWREFQKRNEKMPLAIVLGGDPAFMLASAAVLPSEIDACSLAGAMRDKPLETAVCRSVDLPVPAEAEMVLEGYLDPQAPTAATSPMLSPLGDLTASRNVPVMHVTAITHRANPVYPAILYGRPPHEASCIARSLARIFLPVMKAAIEELVDYDLPEFAAGRFWAALSIRKSYAGQARRVVNAAWSMKPFRDARWLAIVDEDIDVHDLTAVMRSITANVHPQRDVWTQHDVCDRMAFDATRK
jgi:4-hydroxy-3-polyprenylbenzoate decarboxylase